MRMITGSLVVLGLVGAITGSAGVTSAAAQGVYIQGPGFGVNIGRPAYRERYHYGGYRHYGDAYAYSGRRYYRGHPRYSYRWRHSDWD
jgi:hypothetical protein